ncbi:MAG: DNA-protecting protein DprA [Clostridiales bacterium]|nr:DNA-protecting protein DprA [Clostridiales bacterium]
MTNDLEYWLRLSCLEGVKNIIKIDLITALGDAKKVYEASKEILLRAGFSKENYRSFYSEDIRNEALNIIDNCTKEKIEILTITNQEYPEMLKYIPDPPIVLYVLGNIPKSNCVAIVGSRKASGYGIETASKMAFNLAYSDITIVSGMARGIDTAAHSGALEAGGKTVAVLGSGLDVIYPPENKNLMTRIIKSGAVISEYPPGSPPSTIHFPCRNRIISGMSLGTLVVEAGMKSGSLITAGSALEQGREVFAIPGNINNYNSVGTNKLIKDGAKMVINVDDILEELSFGIAPIEKKKKGKRKKNNHLLSQKEKKIISILKIEDLYDQELSNKTSLELTELFEILLDLELKGLIKKSINGKFMLIS